MRAKLIYKDIAPGADVDASVITSDAQSFCSPALLPFDTSVPPIITLEPNMWLLDGSFKLLRNQDIPFWSKQMSDENGVFSTPPVIEIEFDEQYTTFGIYLRFSPETGDYCTSVTIKWYQDATLLDSKDFAPTSVSYFCANKVTAFNKVVIFLNATNRPHRYARVENIIFGIIREFGADEFRSVTILQELDLISSELPISTLNWLLVSKSDIEYIFQLKQPVEAYSGSNLIGVFYISEAKRTGPNTYEITCEDALGVLDGYFFPAAIYSEYNAAQLLQDIASPDFDVEIDSVFEDVTVTGLIPDCTKREAFQQVLFAIGAACTTAGRAGIKVFAPPAENPAEIPDCRIYVGGSMETEPIVTAVRVTAHTYTPGTGSAGDEVIEVGGQKYVHKTFVVTVTNPNVTATDKQNVITVETATLVNPNNANEVAQRVYDYFMRRHTLNERIVVNGEQPGDYVITSTPWDTIVEGNIISMLTILSNTTASDIRIKAKGD